LDALTGVVRCALPVLAIFLMIIAFDIIIAINSQRVSNIKRLRFEQIEPTPN
jgi:hypothetical protein